MEVASRLGGSQGAAMFAGRRGGVGTKSLLFSEPCLWVQRRGDGDGEVGRSQGVGALFSVLSGRL